MAPNVCGRAHSTHLVAFVLIQMVYSYCMCFGELAERSAGDQYGDQYEPLISFDLAELFFFLFLEKVTLSETY